MTVKQVAEKYGQEIKRINSMSGGNMGRSSLHRWLNDNLEGEYSKHFARMVLKELYENQENAPAKTKKMHPIKVKKMHPPTTEKMHPAPSEKMHQKSADDTEDALRRLFNMGEGWKPVRVWGSAERPMVKWERVNGNITEEEIHAFINEIATASIKPTKVSPEETIGVLSIRDTHFGLKTSHPGPYESYNLEEASNAYQQAAAYLTAKAKRDGVTHLVLPFGSDMLHVDNSVNTTTKGTPQDVDVFWWEAFSAAMKSVIAVVNHAKKEIGKVTLILEQGNHDYNLSRALAAALEERWPDVEILGGNNTVKRITYGNTHLFFHHGNDIKPESYLGIIANTYPDSLNPNNYIEVLNGHYHHRNKTTLNGSGDYWESGRLNYRITPALCPSSNWSEANGYSSEPGAQLTTYNQNSVLALYEWRAHQHLKK